MKISIVIPVYNERATIKELLERVRRLALDKEIIVVDDGSKDGSREILKSEIEGLPGVRVFYQSVNQGKGAALRRGFDEARGDIVMVQDADLELDPEDILRIVAPVVEGRAEVVYGSRFMNAASRPASLSYWANRFLTSLTNLLYGAVVTDMETCYKCCRAPVLKRFRIESDRFDFEPEITAKLLRLGYAIHEIPVGYHPRTSSQGKKIGWRDGFKAIYTLLKYRFASVERIERRGAPAAAAPGA
ncbi:MAG: glycosyltransferase family 2 protein [Elusimicrobia bacterium]|nr:glycosyltransferase family 2 protein [Elusimicrobiota bacterium]